MKSIITFLLCLTAALGWSLPIQSHHAAVARLRVAGGGGGGPTFIIDEDFEGTGTPSSWYVSGADFDYAAAALIGSQSARLSANAQYIGISDGGVLNHVELYGKFRFKPETLPTGSFCKIMELQNSSFVAVMTIVIQPSGALECGGTPTSDTMTAGTSYWIYWHYLKGTGSNAVTECGFSSTETRPTSGTKYSGITNANSTTNATQTQTYISSGAVLVQDQFQISTTAFN